jgi:Fibronectin type III domain
MLPMLASASVSTTLKWNPSTDPSVTGYNIYYGTESHNYSSIVTVENTTSATIGNLPEGTMYYFAVKARDDAGDESDFSNEAIFTSCNASTASSFQLNILPPSLVNDRIIFSLGARAPAGITINPASGVITWDSNFTDANMATNISVIVINLTHPNVREEITVAVTFSNYFNLALPSVPVQTGLSASLPITLATSEGATNLAFTVNWAGDQLLNPTLAFNAPVAGGNLINQETNLLVQLWTANGDALTGSNQIAQINFQAAANQPSAFISVPISTLVATKADGSILADANGKPGEVVVVGVNPLLRPGIDANQNRALTLYSNPGTNYQLQQSTDISSPANWQALCEYQPASVQQTISLDSANPVIFYRLMQE